MIFREKPTQPGLVLQSWEPLQKHTSAFPACKRLIRSLYSRLCESCAALMLMTAETLRHSLSPRRTQVRFISLRFAFFIASGKKKFCAKPRRPLTRWEGVIWRFGWGLLKASGYKYLSVFTAFLSEVELIEHNVIVALPKKLLVFRRDVERNFAPFKRSRALANLFLYSTPLWGSWHNTVLSTKKPKRKKNSSRLTENTVLHIPLTKSDFVLWCEAISETFLKSWHSHLKEISTNPIDEYSIPR